MLTPSGPASSAVPSEQLDEDEPAQLISAPTPLYNEEAKRLKSYI